MFQYAGQHLFITYQQARSQDLFQGGQQLIDTRGVARILVRGRRTSDKISSKVAKFASKVRSSDIQQKFTQQRLQNILKIYIKIAQKFRNFSRIFQEKINKNFKRLRNF